MNRLFAGLAVLWALFFLCYCTGRHNDPAAYDVAALPRPAGDFIVKVAEEHMASAELGRYASGQASDWRLRTYGWHMLAFHRAALQRVRVIAAVRDIRLKDTMDEGYRRLVDSLKQKAGNPFDSTFMSVMAEREKMMIGDYDQAIQKISDPQIKAFAAAERDSLLQHLVRITAIRDSINVKKKRWAAP